MACRVGDGAAAEEPHPTQPPARGVVRCAGEPVGYSSGRVIAGGIDRLGSAAGGRAARSRGPDHRRDVACVRLHRDHAGWRTDAVCGRGTYSGRCLLVGRVCQWVADVRPAGSRGCWAPLSSPRGKIWSGRRSPSGGGPRLWQKCNARPGSRQKMLHRSNKNGALQHIVNPSAPAAASASARRFPA